MRTFTIDADDVHCVCVSIAHTQLTMIVVNRPTEAIRSRERTKTNVRSFRDRRTGSTNHAKNMCACVLDQSRSRGATERCRDEPRRSEMGEKFASKPRGEYWRRYVCGVINSTRDSNNKTASVCVRRLCATECSTHTLLIDNSDSYVFVLH